MAITVKTVSPTKAEILKELAQVLVKKRVRRNELQEAAEHQLAADVQISIDRLQAAHDFIRKNLPE